MSPYRPVPSVPPLALRLDVQRLVCAVAALALVVMAGVAVACGAQAPTLQNASQAADVTALGVDLDDCVASATTWAAYDACKAHVLQQWCGPGQRLQEQRACGDAGPDAATALGPTLTRIVDAAEKKFGATGVAQAVVNVVVSDAGKE